MGDRAIITAALIIGGAIVASSFQSHQRFALSAADNSVAWRMDTWSGEVDLCAAVALPEGPLVRCGALMVLPTPPVDASGQATPQPAPATPGPGTSPLDSRGNRTL